MSDSPGRFLVSSVAWIGGPAHSEAISQVQAAGFGGVEILCKQGHFVQGDRACIADALSALRDWPDAVVTFHAPFWDVDLASCDRGEWDRSMRETMVALDTASQLGAANMTIHARKVEMMQYWDDANREALHRSLDRLSAAASERRITIALENLPHPHFTSDENDLLRVVEPYPSDVVGACIDTGHAHLGGTVVRIASLLAPRTFVTHLHDNCARGKDEHLIPGRGTIPWAEVVEAMAGFRGKPVLEVLMTGTLGETLASVREAIEKTGLSDL